MRNGNFQAKIEKTKNFLYFRKIELSGSTIKKFFIFTQKKAFHIFRETETELSYISVSNFPSLKNFLYFKKWKFLAPKRLNKTLLNFLAPKNLNKTSLNFIDLKKLSKTFLYS